MKALLKEPGVSLHFEIRHFAIFSRHSWWHLKGSFPDKYKKSRWSRITLWYVYITLDTSIYLVIGTLHSISPTASHAMRSQSIIDPYWVRFLTLFIKLIHDDVICALSHVNLLCCYDLVNFLFYEINWFSKTLLAYDLSWEPVRTISI